MGWVLSQDQQGVRITCRSICHGVRHDGYPCGSAYSIPQGILCSKVAGARSPEWEYAQKTLEKQGLLCMLEGRQTPIDPGANPCGDAHAYPATYTTFSSPSSPFFAVRKPGTLCSSVGSWSPAFVTPAWARSKGPCPLCRRAYRMGRCCAWCAPGSGMPKPS